MKVHAGDKPYQCSQCDKIFLIVTPLKFMQHFCIQCSKAFSNNSNLICNIWIYTGKITYNYSQSKKDFLQILLEFKLIRNHFSVA